MIVVAAPHVAGVTRAQMGDSVVVVVPEELPNRSVRDLGRAHEPTEEYATLDRWLRSHRTHQEDFASLGEAS